MLIPRHTVIKPKGYAVYSDPAVPDVERDTLQCVHCGMHWEVIPGSGRKRGFCHRCMGVTCGKQQCEQYCVPQEMRAHYPLAALKIIPDLFKPL